MTAAYLYKSGKLIEVPDGFIHHDILSRDFGLQNIGDAIAQGFVRVRYSACNFLGVQARSKDLAQSAIRMIYNSGKHVIDSVGMEFPGRYIEMSLEECYEWL